MSSYKVLFGDVEDGVVGHLEERIYADGGGAAAVCQFVERLVDVRHRWRRNQPPLCRLSRNFMFKVLSELSEFCFPVHSSSFSCLLQACGYVS